MATPEQTIEKGKASENFIQAIFMYWLAYILKISLCLFHRQKAGFGGLAVKGSRIRNVVFIVCLINGAAMAVTGKTCLDSFSLPSSQQEKIHRIAAHDPNYAYMAQVLSAYEQELKDEPDLAQILPPDEVHSLILDQEMSYYPQMLLKLMQNLRQDFQADTGDDFKRKFRNAAYEMLKDQVPESSIESRIQEFLDHRASLTRLLGDLTRKEVLELLYGSDLQNPDPQSLVGRYIMESGAQKLTRQFNVGPDSNELGPPRLVVAVSEKSFPIFQKYFTRLEFLSVIGHAFVVQNGKLNSYMHVQEPLRASTPGNILPLLVLKTTEAQRAQQFFLALNKYHRGGWFDIVKQPWLMGYCPQSGYDNCTHWIGNIPVGDARVDKWSLPGLMDGPQKEQPRIGEVKPPQSDDPLIQRVFKVPSNMQLSEVIGQKDSNLRGEFANPGWVIQTLIGPTGSEFVPIVFLWTEDHRKPVDPNFRPQFETPR